MDTWYNKYLTNRKKKYDWILPSILLLESVPTVRGIGDLGLLCIQSRVSGADVLNAVAAGSLNELSLWPYLLGFHHSRYLREIMLLLLEFSQILLDTTGLSNRKKTYKWNYIFNLYIFFTYESRQCTLFNYSYYSSRLVAKRITCWLRNCDDVEVRYYFDPVSTCHFSWARVNVYGAQCTRPRSALSACVPRRPARTEDVESQKFNGIRRYRSQGLHTTCFVQRILPIRISSSSVVQQTTTMLNLLIVPLTLYWTCRATNKQWGLRASSLLFKVYFENGAIIYKIYLISSESRKDEKKQHLI